MEYVSAHLLGFGGERDGEGARATTRGEAMRRNKEARALDQQVGMRINNNYSTEAPHMSFLIWYTD